MIIKMERIKRNNIATWSKHLQGIIFHFNHCAMKGLSVCAVGDYYKLLSVLLQMFVADFFMSVVGGAFLDYFVGP